jgi:hypothetical protein
MKDILEKPFGAEPDAWTHKIEMEAEIGKDSQINTGRKGTDSTGSQGGHDDTRTHQKAQ